jgi:hypothetical protein
MTDITGGNTKRNNLKKLEQIANDKPTWDSLTNAQRSEILRQVAVYLIDQIEKEVSDGID